MIKGGLALNETDYLCCKFVAPQYSLLSLCISWVISLESQHGRILVTGYSLRTGCRGVSVEFVPSQKVRGTSVVSCCYGSRATLPPKLVVVLTSWARGRFQVVKLCYGMTAWFCNTVLQDEGLIWSYYTWMDLTFGHFLHKAIAHENCSAGVTW